jgi:NAD(P)-dependent dehydrogenase (short-subunit alcohol dehydrogenase family)
MSITMVFSAPPCGFLGHLPGALQAAGFLLQDSRVAAEPAGMLVNLAEDPQAVMDAAHAFAAQTSGCESERLIVNVSAVPRPDEWDRTKAAAIIGAFTRHAALAWAPAHIRINSLCIGATRPHGLAAHHRSATTRVTSPTGASHYDVVQTILAMWRWRSMTGQMIRLGA